MQQSKVRHHAALSCTSVAITMGMLSTLEEQFLRLAVDMWRSGAVF
jgi:Zn finger protein HypA/HybF involved in hydrogenase expression